MGINADDYLGFGICSIDHLDSLEYHSPAKLVCTSQPWDGKKPNPGPIILMTKSGGRGVSTIKFEFKGDPVVAKKKSLKEKGPSNSYFIHRLLSRTDTISFLPLPFFCFLDDGNKKETKIFKNEVENLRQNVQGCTDETKLN